VLGVVLGGGLRSGVVPGRRSGGAGRREVLGDDCTGMEGGGCTRSGVLGVGTDAEGMEAEGMEAEGMEAELDAVSATDHGAATSTADASVPGRTVEWTAVTLRARRPRQRAAARQLEGPKRPTRCE
jgi:hypothetical protein